MYFFRQPVQLPKRATGYTVQCPSCFSYFTPAPESPRKPAALAPLPGRMEKSPAAAHRTDRPPTGEQDAAVGGSPRPASLPPLVLPAVPDSPPAPLTGLGWLGPAAVLLGVSAYCCSLAAATCFLVIPLGVLGLLAGAAAVVRGGAVRRVSVVGTLGSALGGAVLAAALWSPGLLGLTYLASREPAERGRDAVRLLPVPGRPATADTGHADWPDARLAVLQQGGVTVQVASAAWAPADGPAAARGKGTGKKHLAVRLRVQRVVGGREFATEQWPEASPTQQTPQATLKDAAGKTYPQLPDEPGPDDAGPERRSSVFPVAIADPVLYFDVPPQNGPLRLELSAAAWGGSGVFRFTIPSAMLRPDAGKPTRPVPKRGR